MVNQPLFEVRKVEYATYADIELFGDKASVVVASKLSFEKAVQMAESFGFGYCVYPVNER